MKQDIILSKSLIIFTVSIVGLLLSCKSNVITDDYKPQYDSVYIQQKIEQYYTNNQTDSMLNFIEKWHTSIKPSSEKYIHQNDTIANIYQIVADLFKPYQFSDHTPYRHVDYNTRQYSIPKNKCIVFQTDVDYLVLPLEKFKKVNAYVYFKPHTLHNFRPQLISDSVKYLYLTKEYQTAILKFLKNKNTDIENLNDLKNDSFVNEINKREDFLFHLLNIQRGHWKGWHIPTFPSIEKIIFDINLQNAFINVRIDYGQTIENYKLVKENGHWKDGKNNFVIIRQE